MKNYDKIKMVLDIIIIVLLIALIITWILK